MVLGPMDFDISRVKIKEGIEITTNSAGAVESGMSGLVPGSKDGDILLNIYFSKSTDITASIRRWEIMTYGNAGYRIIFRDVDNNAYASKNIKFTAVYYSV